jgi:FSR family fosmidomycin resistance protein-like MFS transporter
MQSSSTPTQASVASQTVYPILFSICFAHLLNDLLQSVIPSLYPVMREKYHLSFSQVGWITFTFQLTASLLQPFVGNYTDKRPKPYSFALGMGFTFFGIVLLIFSSGFSSILLAVGFVGIGSSVFHPEASKVSYYASGGRRGLAQSIFQLGGNTGTAIGPMLVAAIVVKHGQLHLSWFLLFAILGMFILIRVGNWYKGHLVLRAAGKVGTQEQRHDLPRKTVITSIIILLILIFSKYFYLTSITSYYTFYLMQKFHLTISESQFHLSLFLISVAAGTFLGGPLGDKFGRKIIIWVSILGIAPFTILLPHVNLFWTSILTIIIGVIMASAFSAILVYAQELLPGKIGMISGLFFGFAFGIAGIGSALLGNLADHTSIEYVFNICAFLPLLGIITGFLPNIKSPKRT